MGGKVSQYVWRLTASTWMCVEIGQFFEQRAGLIHNSLFWPFWITLVLALFLGSLVLDFSLKK